MFPNGRRFGIARYVVLLVADEGGHIEILRVEADLFGQKFEEPRQLLLLEVITERPIAEHLEKSDVPVVPHFFDIFRAETFLAVDQAIAQRVLLTQEIRDKRLHTASGEKCRRVVARYE